MAQTQKCPTAGLGVFTAGLQALVTADANYFAWGTGTTALAAGDTTLEGENTRNARVSDTAGSGVETVAGWLSSGDANGITIAKVGVFNLLSGGTLLAETLLDVGQRFAKTNAVEVWADAAFTFTVTDAS